MSAAGSAAALPASPCLMHWLVHRTRYGAQVADKPLVRKRPGRSQRPWKGPAAPGPLPAVQAEVQVCPTAWTACRRVGDDRAADRHHAEQVGLGGTGSAADARPDR